MHETGSKRHVLATRVGRRVLVAASLLALSGAVVSLLVHPTRSFVERLGSGPPAGGWVLSELVVGSATCLTLVAAVVLAASGIATALAADSSARSTRWIVRWAPHGYRRLVLAACGSAIALPSITAPAPALEPDPVRDRVADFPSLTGLRLPDLPTSANGPPTQRPTIVRVKRGDSLWSIAAELIGPHAPADHIATYVSDLYSLNLHSIGPDPDLIIPGTELTTPGGTR